MNAEELWDAFYKQTPVILERFRGLEPPLHFSRIAEIIPEVDKRGKLDYGVVLVDSVGRLCTARGKDVKLG